MSAATLGARVKAAREAAGLSQRQLGIDSGLASRIESGKAVDPGIATMTAIAKATGKTIDELMGAPASAVRMVPLCDIEADPQNPRTVDVANTVDAAFVDSIREHGLLQAVTVRRMPADHEGAAWRIAYGGRRHAALVLIHGPKAKVPVPVLVTEAQGGDLLLKQLVENIARADMNPADLAEAIHCLVEEKMDTASLAAVLKKGRRWVQEQASVGRWLTVENTEALRKGRLNISQAVAIAAEHDAERQNKLAAHAELQGLTEDEIRAIIADRKAKETAAKTEAEEAKQPALIEDVPGPAWPKPNNHGVFTEVPKTYTWHGKRGGFSVRLVQFSDDQWAVGYNCDWRVSSGHPGRGSSTGPSTHWTEPTAAAAFLEVARRNYPMFVECAKRWPEDRVAVAQLHSWILLRLGEVGASPEAIDAWFTDYPPPEKPSAKPAPAPTPSSNNRKVRMLPDVDITKAPTWAAPMVDALFMYHTGRQAFLCKGWLHMAKTFSEHMDADQEELRALFNRAAWANDTEGKPFDFGGAVVRLLDAPA